MNEFNAYLEAIQAVSTAKSLPAKTTSKRAAEFDAAKRRIEDAFAEKTVHFEAVETAISDRTAEARELLNRVDMDSLVPSTISQSEYKGDPDAFIESAPVKLEHSVEEIRQSVLALVRLNEKEAVDRKSAAERERVAKLEAERKQRDEERERLKEDQRLAAQRAAADAQRKQIIKFVLVAAGIAILVLVIALAL